MIAEKILYLLSRRKTGMSLQKIAQELNLNRKEKIILGRKLSELENQGAVFRIKRKYYIRPRTNFARGDFSTASKGNGFVKPSSGEADIFIPFRFRNKAVTGDVVDVVFKPSKKKKGYEGRILKVLEKRRSALIGVIQKQGSNAFFIPLDSPQERAALSVPEGSASLADGNLALIERDSYRVLKVLGDPDEPGVDVQATIEKYDLPSRFSLEVLREAESIPFDTVSEELKDREVISSNLAIQDLLFVCLSMSPSESDNGRTAFENAQTRLLEDLLKIICQPVFGER